MTKNRTPTPVYLDPGMHPGLEVKRLNCSPNNIPRYHIFCVATFVLLGPYTCTYGFNPLTAKIGKFSISPLENASRDSQLQVSENYSDLAKGRSTIRKSRRLISLFNFNMIWTAVFTGLRANAHISSLVTAYF